MPAAPVFIFAQGRSGTNMFRSMLETGFNVPDMGEVLNVDGGPRETDYYPFLIDWLKRNPDAFVPDEESQTRRFDDYIGHLCASASTPLIAVDVKYSSSHLLNPLWFDAGDPPFIIQLVKQRNFRTIHLIRRDLLARHASAHLARTTGVWVDKGETTEMRSNSTLKLDPQSVRRALAAELTQIRFFGDAMQDNPRMITLYYEDMLQDGCLNPKIAKDVADFLGLDPPASRIAPETVKIAPDLQSLLENYDEIIDALSDTPLADLAVTSN